MDIQILQQIDGAKKAKGTAVIIDVFRAFTLECYLMEKGAARVLPVGQEETARRLQKAHPEYLLVGERHGVILPGFHYGNSPAQIKGAELFGRTIVHTTSAGTQGVVNASGALEILTGSLVNAKAVADYLKKKNCRQVSLVCMGWEGRQEAPEDTICAEYIKSLLEETPYDLEAALEWLRTTSQGAKFFLPENQSVFPEEDYWMCTDVDRFDFVLGVKPLETDVFESSIQT